MYEFDKLYRSIIGEGKADPSDKKGSKLSWNKHRNKEETRQSSRKSRRQGKEGIKKGITESMYGSMGRGENAENYGGDDDFIDLHYNLKDFLDKFGRDLEKSYHHYKSIDAPGFSEAGDLVESVIDAIDDINEQAQGEGTREEFVELKDKVHDLVRDLNDMYEDVGSEAQNVIEQIIDELNDELETY